MQGPGDRVRAAVWALHLVLPLLGLWLLLAQPQLDIHWQHEPSHFWMVLTVAAGNTVLGLRMSEVARRREDARLFLVSLAFVASATFLFLHALATPGVLVHEVGGGFSLATPVGLVLASVFAAASSLPFTPEGSAAIIRRQGWLRGGLLVLAAGWAVVSLAELPPLQAGVGSEQVGGVFVAVLGAAAGLYVFAAYRYWLLHRRRPAVMLLSVLTAWALLAEATIAVAFAPSWQLSWWEWHLLMTAAFGYVAYSAHVQYRREGSGAGLFDGIVMEQTLRQVRAEYGDALETFVQVLRRQAATGGVGPESELVLAGLASRFDLTEGQVRVLGRAGEALASERDQVRRLDALVAIGTQTRVVVAETELLRSAVAQFAASLGRDRIRVGLVTESRLTFTPDLATAAGWTARDDAAAQAVLRDAEDRRAATVTASQPPATTTTDGTTTTGTGTATTHPTGSGDIARGGPTGSADRAGTLADSDDLGDDPGGGHGGDGEMVLPLMVKDHLAGVLQVSRPGGGFGARDTALLRSLASQLSIALENTRLYRQIDALFRQFMSPDVATQLLADPDQARLGGALVEVTALFADLRGFTTFSERVAPAEIVTLLNRYHAVTVPRVLDEGGTVVQFVGDALMALFNAPARQPDHALRAARAALAIQRTITEISAGQPDWPRFRIGINTGLALVGNIGSDQLRNFNAMGDAVNVAARLESVAEPGQVVIGASTRAAIGEAAVVDPLGDLPLKGKEETVTAYVLTGLQGPDGSRSAEVAARARTDDTGRDRRGG